MITYLNEFETNRFVDVEEDEAGGSAKSTGSGPVSLNFEEAVAAMYPGL